jgi:hypothetical protein
MPRQVCKYPGSCSMSLEHPMATGMFLSPRLPVCMRATMQICASLSCFRNCSRACFDQEAADACPLGHPPHRSTDLRQLTTNTIRAHVFQGRQLVQGLLSHPSNKNVYLLWTSVKTSNIETSHQPVDIWRSVITYPVLEKMFSMIDQRQMEGVYPAWLTQGYHAECLQQLLIVRQHFVIQPRYSIP